LGLRPRELTEKSYDSEWPPESVSDAPAHKIGKEAIRLLIAAIGTDQKKEQHLFRKRNYTIRIRI